LRSALMASSSFDLSGVALADSDGCLASLDLRAQPALRLGMTVEGATAS
jgi:hypothetical protein